MIETYKYNDIELQLKLIDRDSAYGIISAKNTSADDELFIANYFNSKPIREICRESFKDFKGKRIVIPNTVETIGYEAFCKCKNLKQIDFQFEPKLNLIGERAFFGTGLKTLFIPKSVEFICADAFANCCLQNLFFENGSQLRQIGTAAFKNSRFESVTLNLKNTIIGSHSFSNNPRLRSVNLQNSDNLNLQFSVFSECPNFKTVVPPIYNISYYSTSFPNADLTKVIEDALLFK